jgi:hypothetical protein
LLLEPELDLSWFSRDDFIALTSGVGTNRINKQWTSPVVTLPAHPRSGVQGLTLQEVKDYMKQARTLFNDGQAVPVSDVGLISTQEDVIRKPMLNHISAFSNDVARVYLLVQKQSTETNWGMFSIVQDMTVDPPGGLLCRCQSRGTKLSRKILLQMPLFRTSGDSSSSRRFGDRCEVGGGHEPTHQETTAIDILLADQPGQT